jgi:hypothetical protein
MILAEYSGYGSDKMECDVMACSGRAKMEE